MFLKLLCIKNALVFPMLWESFDEGGTHNYILLTDCAFVMSHVDGETNQTLTS